MSADIFVDRTGRRRLLLTWLAAAAAVALVGTLGLLAAGLFAGGPLPLQGWSDRDGPTSGPDAAVIGPAPTPAPPATPRSARPTGPPPTAASPTARPSGTAGPSDRPGRGNGRDNRPTAKPSHPQSKAG